MSKLNRVVDIQGVAKPSHTLVEEIIGPILAIKASIDDILKYHNFHFMDTNFVSFPFVVMVIIEQSTLTTS
mgnify:CR=1 FL=1